MAWERRQRGPESGYLYRSVRDGDRVRKVYLGRGEAAHDEDAALERRREGRREAKRLLQSDWDGIDEAERIAAEQREWASVLLSAFMVLAGHHKRRGQWRGVSRG